MIDIPCIIFAGGKSSRMGEDKSLLPFSHYNTLTEYQLSRLNKLFKQTYISCKDKHKFDFINNTQEINFIEDIKSESLFAPTAGFISIFNNLDVDRFFVLSVDSPFVSEAEILKLIANDNSNLDATIAKTKDGIHPMCGIYHRSLETTFTDMLKNNNHKLTQMLKHSNTNYVFFENESPFLNINNPDDYKQAIKLL